MTAAGDTITQTSTKAILQTGVAPFGEIPSDYLRFSPDAAH
jgi:hypothetical protein